MEENIEKKQELKSRLIHFFDKNKFKFFILISLIVITIFALLLFQLNFKKKNSLIAEKYIQAGVYLANKKNADATLIFEEIIESLDSSTDEEDYPASKKKNSSSSFTPDVVKDYDRGGYEKYRILERFEKIKVPYYRLFNKETQEEKIVDLESFQKVLSENSHLIESGLVEADEVLQTRIRHVATVGQVLLY